jgi:exonuclease 1
MLVTEGVRPFFVFDGG